MIKLNYKNISFLLLLVCSNISLAMKREGGHLEEPVAKHQCLNHALELESSFARLSYAAFLSTVYEHKELFLATEPKEPFFELAIRTIFSCHRQEYPTIYRVVVEWPSCKRPGATLQFSYEKHDCIIDFMVNALFNHDSCACILKYKIILNKDPIEYFIVSENAGLLSNAEIAQQAHAVLGEIFPFLSWRNLGSYAPLSPVPLQGDLNWMERGEFEVKLNELQDRPLIDKMAWLNNGSIVGENIAPNLWIEPKSGIVFQVVVKLGKYHSNSMAEKNFLKEDSYSKNSYYFVSFHFSHDLDAEYGQEQPSLLLRIAIDGGYGATELPSELVWLQKEVGLSGTEILRFAHTVLKFLAPRMVYLNDASQVSTKATAAPLRVVRAIWKTRSLYAEYADFDVVNCTDMIGHETEPSLLTQSKDSYVQSVNYLHDFEASKLSDLIIDRKIKNRVQKVVKDFPNELTLSALIDALFKSRKNDFEFFTNELLLRPSTFRIKESSDFVKHLEVLYDVTLLQRSYNN